MEISRPADRNLHIELSPQEKGMDTWYGRTASHRPDVGVEFEPKRRRFNFTARGVLRLGSTRNTQPTNDLGEIVMPDPRPPIIVPVLSPGQPSPYSSS